MASQTKRIDTGAKSPGDIGAVKDAIRAHALDLGFDVVGFSPAGTPETVQENLSAFLKAGRHGEMAWLENRAEQRKSPDALWSEAKSVVVLGMLYTPEIDPLSQLNKRAEGALSVYAQGRDYHDVLKKRQKRLARWMVEAFGCDVKVFVDTAPVMEKPLAQQAGIGWQGKHTNLVSRDFGSWLFLGEVFTTLDLPPDDAEQDYCGGCTRCVDVCPTGALDEAYRIDARKCISYLTIEHKGHIAPEFRDAMGNRIYGCDDCLAVCPWNKFAPPMDHPEFRTRQGLESTMLGELAALDDAGFRARFSGSPIKRIGRERFVRNVLIAIGNSGEKKLAEDARRLLSDASPLVRAMAVWALSRLLPAAEMARLRARHAASETDADVLKEWAASEISHAPAP